MKKTANAKKSAKISRPGKRKSRQPNDKERAFLQTIGEKIKDRRVAAEMTADELSEAVGVALGTHFNREAGRVSMPVEELHRYAAVLKCRPSDLI